MDGVFERIQRKIRESAIRDAFVRGPHPPGPCGNPATRHETRIRRRRDGLLTRFLFSADLKTQSMIFRIGIMLEYSNPRFLKNSWDSALMRSVSRVMRLKCFFFAKSAT